MGMGTDSAAGAGGGGGLLQGASALFAGPSPGASSGTSAPYGASSYATSGGGGGFMQYISDPEVLKAVGGAVTGLGKAVTAVQTAPERRQAQMFQLAMQQMQQQNQGMSGDIFLGDSLNLDPRAAQQVLRALGVPFGAGGGAY